MSDYRGPKYVSTLDRTEHLKANARARGSTDGALFEYEADREAMNPTREAVASARAYRRERSQSGRVAMGPRRRAARKLAEMRSK